MKYSRFITRNTGGRKKEQLKNKNIFKKLYDILPTKLKRKQEKR